MIEFLHKNIKKGGANMTLATCALGALLVLASSSVFSQANSVTPLSRTEHGYPDFQGNWQNLHQTPLERPVELGEKQAYSEEEAFALIEQARLNLLEKGADLDPGRGAPQEGRVTNQADDDFDELPIDMGVVNGEYRTSLIIDPPDGRIPYVEWPLPPGLEFFFTLRGTPQLLDGPEAAWAAERCLIAGPQLSMMYQRGLSPYTQIVQTKDYLMILGEYPYDARIIRIGGDHSDPGFPKWMGDSIANWDGDTLVIHTEKFRDEQSFPPILSSESTEVVERLSLMGGDIILYEYTVTDPDLYNQPFTAQVPFTRMASGQTLYEYACHEGNYSFAGSLTGARVEEVRSEFGKDEDQ